MEQWSRTVFPAPPRDVDPGVGVFTGIFGARWLSNAFENLDRQTAFPVAALIAVNGSDDYIVSRCLEFQERSIHAVTVAVNSVNLGPMGSFYRNRDLTAGDWIAFMHQDDVYLDIHLTELARLIDQAADTTVGLFTALGGVSEDGDRSVAPPPMSNEHLRLRESWTVVPEIVRKHPFPTPAFAVRRDVHVDDLAWYDSGAPDSEWFARLACMGTLEVSDTVTVLYRQPSDSESTTTDSATRAWLWAASIERIVSSPEFEELLCRMPVESRSTFAAAFLTAVTARYPESPVFEFVRFVAAQKMVDVWSYTEPRSVEALRSDLEMFPPSAALHSLCSVSGPSERTLADRSGVRELVGRVAAPGPLDRSARLAYRRFGHRVPGGLRSQALKLYRSIRRGSL
jgi:hypothetical protein